MKKTLYTFLVWNFLLFVAGLSDIVFYRNLTSVEGMTISWTQPALVSITSFLILLSIYYGMHRLLFGEKNYLKLEVNQEDVDKMRDSIFAFLKKGEISPKNLQQHLREMRRQVQRLSLKHSRLHFTISLQMQDLKVP